MLFEMAHFWQKMIIFFTLKLVKALLVNNIALTFLICSFIIKIYYCMDPLNVSAILDAHTCTLKNNERIIVIFISKLTLS